MSLSLILLTNQSSVDLSVEDRDEWAPNGTDGEMRLFTVSGSRP